MPAPWNRAYSERQQQELCPGRGPFETFVGESSTHSYESQIKQGKIKQGDTRPATHRRRLEAKRPPRELQKPPRWWGRGSLWWKKRALQPTRGGSGATGALPAIKPAQECKPDTALPYLSFSSESRVAGGCTRLFQTLAGVTGASSTGTGSVWSPLCQFQRKFCFLLHCSVNTRSLWGSSFVMQH